MSSFFRVDEERKNNHCCFQSIQNREREEMYVCALHFVCLSNSNHRHRHRHHYNDDDHREHELFRRTIPDSCVEEGIEVEGMFGENFQRGERNAYLLLCVHPILFAVCFLCYV